MIATAAVAGATFACTKKTILLPFSLPYTSAFSLSLISTMRTEAERTSKTQTQRERTCVHKEVLEEEQNLSPYAKLLMVRVKSLFDCWVSQQHSFLGTDEVSFQTANTVAHNFLYRNYNYNATAPFQRTKSQDRVFGSTVVPHTGAHKYPLRQKPLWRGTYFLLAPCRTHLSIGQLAYTAELNNHRFEYNWVKKERGSNGVREGGGGGERGREKRGL